MLNLSRVKKEIAFHDDEDGVRGQGSRQSSSDGPAGADDFLPLFIWVVLRSQIPQLYSNCEYIHAFMSPARLIGKAGYSLINLESAIAFLTHITPDCVAMDPQEFEKLWTEAEEMLNPF
jgi:hypothetical protein